MYELREIIKEDLNLINHWRNDEGIINYLGAPFRYINRLVDEKWFENYMNNRNSQVRCAIIDDDKVIGMVSLTNINYVNMSCVFHIMIGADSQNNGAGTFAVKKMLSHAFKNMNMHRVELSVLEYNKRAIHLYEKCGFVYEGKKRGAVYKNGKYEDMLIYAILCDDYYD